MEDGVTMRISDQGCGFDPDRRNSGAGIGLIGMSERLRLIGGRLSVNSQHERGTDIIAEVPLAVTAKESQLKAQAAGE
jgi:signal transduction histidine kinase